MRGLHEFSFVHASVQFGLALPKGIGDRAGHTQGMVKVGPILLNKIIVLASFQAEGGVDGIAAFIKGIMAESVIIDDDLLDGRVSGCTWREFYA